MKTVPLNKSIYWERKKYRGGDELPKDYKGPSLEDEPKKTAKPGPDKKPTIKSEVK